MSKLIRMLRIRKELTQKQLAKGVGVQQSTISRIENNLIGSSFKVILSILIYLNAQSNDVYKYFTEFCSKNHYEFLCYLLSDENIRNIIEQDPVLYSRKVKELLYSNSHFY